MRWTTVPVRAEPAPRVAGPVIAARSRPRPPLVREVLLIVTLFLVYRLGRLVITGHDQLAISNAWWVWDVERALGLPDEELLQDWALQWPDLLRAANWYYVTVHFPLTAAFLAWGWWRRPAVEYRWARRLITVLTGLALVVHVMMPLAPPRMLSSLGFLDTMAVFGPSAYGGSTDNIANEFAAMPSLHVGWALLLAVVVVRTTSTPWRWVTLLHPAVTIAVVVATANHYWIDAIAAAALLAVALAVTPTPYGPPPAVGLWRRRRGLVALRGVVPPFSAAPGSPAVPVEGREPVGALRSGGRCGPPRPREPDEAAPVPRAQPR
jgi:hypothetical protein